MRDVGVLTSENKCNSFFQKSELPFGISKFRIAPKGMQFIQQYIIYMKLPAQTGLSHEY